jgi:integrase
MARKTMRRLDYLFKPRNSENWWIRLQHTNPDLPGVGKTGRLERTLGTRDRIEAEVLAGPLINEHRKWRLSQPSRRPSVVTEMWQHELEPGKAHVDAEGRTVIATDRELTTVNADGSLTTRPNGAPSWNYSGVIGSDNPDFRRATMQVLVDRELKARDRPKLQGKDADDVLFRNYLEHGGKARAGVHGEARKEAENIWHLMKSRLEGKRLKDMTRADGRELVAYLEKTKDHKGNLPKSATVQRKMKTLAAVVNLAISDGQLTFNPFSSVAPNRNDALVRLPFTEAEMQIMRDRIGHLIPQDALLLTLLAASGMRLSEAFRLNHEMIENGVRYTIVGINPARHRGKTDQSRRRVPFPAAVLPLLPEKIDGPVFGGTSNSASRRLAKFIRKVCGITDPAKVVHSFRHRAKDRLRAVGCPLDVQYELLGHEEKTVAAGYGVGSPMPLLKDWIDKIGF